MELLLLSREDFKETKIDSNWSGFDFLLEIARVHELQEEKEKCNKNRGTKSQRKKNVYWGFKCFKDIVFKEEQVGNKKKRKHQEEWQEKDLKKKKKLPVCPVPPSALCESLKQIILEKGGSDLGLVIQKPLFKSDVDPKASRFSIPLSQIQTLFLTETEAAELKAQKSIRVCLLEPSMKESFLSLRRWDMHKTSMYVLKTLWNSVVENNGLCVNDIVQLWSFRVHSDLCFALVKLPTH